jgi:hypothetical protein
MVSAILIYLKLFHFLTRIILDLFVGESRLSICLYFKLVEQELLTLPEYMSSPPVFSGVRVTRSLVLYVCFVDRCLSFCTFSFGHCVVCPSLRYTDSDNPFCTLQQIIDRYMYKCSKNWYVWVWNMFRQNVFNVNIVIGLQRNFFTCRKHSTRQM